MFLPTKKIIAVLSAAVMLAVAALWIAEEFAPDSSSARKVELTIDSMRRISPSQYRNIIRDVFGNDITINGRFVNTKQREEGLLAVGASKISISTSGFDMADRMARDIASQVVSERHRRQLIPCQPQNETFFDEDCARQFMSRAGRLLYRRPLSAAESDKLIEVARLAADQDGTFFAGLEKSLTYLLVSPSFLFRIEYASPPVKSNLWNRLIDADGEHQLDAWSKASRLSFLLWNSSPDSTLLAAAERGELDTSQGLAQQVDRMLSSPWLEDGVRAFFDDMLAFDTFDTLSKDATLFPQFTHQVAEDSREQTLRTVVDHLLTRDLDYRDLFTTRKTFLTPVLAALLELPLVQVKKNRAPDRWEAYEFGVDDPRAGILMQPSFLAVHSYPGRTSPTLRGKALRENLLCQEVPPPPADVDFNLVEDTSNPDFKTVRQRLDAHVTNPTCAGCHKITDPIGFALENFDGVGAYRTHENGALIDASGEMNGIPYQNAAGFSTALRDDPNVVSCLVRRVFAYGTGQTLESVDRKWLKKIRSHFADNGYKLRSLLREITTSDEFYGGLNPEREGYGAVEKISTRDHGTDVVASK